MRCKAKIVGLALGVALMLVFGLAGAQSKAKGDRGGAGGQSSTTQSSKAKAAEKSEAAERAKKEERTKKDEAAVSGKKEEPKPELKDVKEKEDKEGVKTYTFGAVEL